MAVDLSLWIVQARCMGPVTSTAASGPEQEHLTYMILQPVWRLALTGPRSYGIQHLDDD